MGASYSMYHSKREYDSELHSIAITMYSRVHNVLISWEPVSPSLSTTRFWSGSLGETVTAVCALTLQAEPNFKDAFCNEPQGLVDRIPKRDILLIAGD